MPPLITWKYYIIILDLITVVQSYVYAHRVAAAFAAYSIAQVAIVPFWLISVRK